MTQAVVKLNVQSVKQALASFVYTNIFLLDQLLSNR